jgi:hypothetical protein
MSQLTLLLQRYVAALETGLAVTNDARDRNEYHERLSAAAEIAEAIDVRDLGRAASIVHSEEPAIGWSQLGGPDVSRSFMVFAAALQSARLEGAPDAGFGH